MSKNTESPKKRTSRAKYQCPPELAEMIKLIQLVKPDTLLVNLVEAFELEILEVQKQKQLMMFFPKPGPEVDLERVFRKLFPDITPISILKGYIEHTPSEFQDYVMAEPEYLKYKGPIDDDEQSDSRRFIRAVKRYTDFCNIRQGLQTLIRNLEIEREAKARGGSRDIHWIWLPLTLSTTVTRSSDGKLQPSGLVKLLGTFDDSRLRSCDICKHIFWAKREDSKTCSPKCLNRLNVRKSRKLTAEEKAAKKAQREANRKLKKEGIVKTTKRRK